LNVPLGCYAIAAKERGFLWVPQKFRLWLNRFAKHIIMKNNYVLENHEIIMILYKFHDKDVFCASSFQISAI
jgi:hypothetical protein